MIAVWAQFDWTGREDILVYLLVGGCEKSVSPSSKWYVPHIKWCGKSGCVHHSMQSAGCPVSSSCNILISGIANVCNVLVCFKSSNPNAIFLLYDSKFVVVDGFLTDQRKRAWCIMVWTAATRYYYNYWYYLRLVNINHRMHGCTHTRTHAQMRHTFFFFFEYSVSHVNAWLYMQNVNKREVGYRVPQLESYENNSNAEPSAYKQTANAHFFVQNV